MNEEQIKNNFSFHPPKDEETKQKYEVIRNTGLRFALDIKRLVPEGREQALAFTKLEEAVMWADKGIARNSK